MVLVVFWSSFRLKGYLEVLKGFFGHFNGFRGILVILEVRGYFSGCGCSLVILVIPRVFLRFGWYFDCFNGYGGILVILVIPRIF